jgi:tellurite resistance protein TerA
MDLDTKKQSAALDSITGLLVKLTWNTAADFDLAALYKTKAGTDGLVFFNNKGDLNVAPFIKLDKDAGVGDKVATGGNCENLKITKLDDVCEVHIIAWDFGAITKGTPARFAGSDVCIELTDSTGATHKAKLDTGDVGNVAVVATIKNGAIGGELINTSKIGLLKQFSKTEQLWEIVSAEATP